MAKKVALLFAGQAHKASDGTRSRRAISWRSGIVSASGRNSWAEVERDYVERSDRRIDENFELPACTFRSRTACLSVLRELAGNFPTGGAAGLSLGEITAYAAAGTSICERSEACAAPRRTNG